MTTIEENEGKFLLSPYWDRSLSESERKSRMDQFLRAIYPIWKPIMGNDQNDFKNMASLHNADLAIFNKGTRPNRGNVGRSSDRALDETPRAGVD